MSKDVDLGLRGCMTELASLGWNEHWSVDDRGRCRILVVEEKGGSQ